MEKVAVSELSEGMILAEAILCPKTKKVLLNKGTKLTESFINQIKSRQFQEILVEELYTLCIDPIDNIRKTLKSSLNEEILKLCPDKNEANKSDKMLEVSRLARNLILEIIDDSVLAGFCVQMKIVDDKFLFTHSVSVCALSMLVAGALDLSEKEMVTIGSAALIHDLGLCEMPHLVSATQRTFQQEALFKEHSLYGYYFAKEAGVADKISNIILHHHEQWNGDGFPGKLSGESIPLGSRIICVCDTFDRAVRFDNIPRYQAIELLYGGGNYFFDSNIVKAVVNNLAVYPLGSMVRLSTGEVGVVVNIRNNQGARPIVRVYYNKVNRGLSSPKDIDLGKERTVFIQNIL
ncbi:MAG TPA: HD domain-containing phosphohydrolase [Pseudobacteroides sp.]|uniref:HD-GYP domain-containing protein n=1 Tax=Pseudobacteroides sp. TaxID=1968840 RepID=UPI002F945AB4